MIGDKIRIKFCIQKADGQHSSIIFHGMGRICTQIHQYLMNLGRIAHNQCITLNVLLDLNGRWYRGSEQLERFFDKRFHLNRLLLLITLPAECKDLLDKIFCPVTGR